MEVIPSINCHAGDIECVKDKLGKAEKFSGWVHLDLADGRFTFNKSWGDPTGWANLRTKINLEVHLMAEEPEKRISQWLAAVAKRFIIHAEAAAPEVFDDIARLVGKKGEAALASNPDTPAEALRPYFKKTKFFQVLAVHPGPAGQKFLPLVLDKVRFLRKEAPDAKIEIDGGVDLETGKLAADAGADILVAATYIFGSDDPRKAFETLKQI